MDLSLKSAWSMRSRTTRATQRNLVSEMTITIIIKQINSIQLMLAVQKDRCHNFYTVEFLNLRNHEHKTKDYLYRPGPSRGNEVN